MRTVLRAERKRTPRGSLPRVREATAAYGDRAPSTSGGVRVELDLEEDLLEAVRARYHLPNDRAAVEYALRRAAVTSMSKEEALEMEGGSPTHLTLPQAVASDAPLATPAPVLMELLAGCGTEEASMRLQRMLARFEILDVEGLADFEDAASIQRTCRRQGDPVRSKIDCLIAALALREARPLLTTDRDFDIIARHVGLELVTTPRS